jgi:nucleotide-binding universal stress UspA family protein
VVDPNKVKSEVLNNWNASENNDKYRDKLKNIETMANASKVTIEIKILHGEPGPTIVDYVNKNNFEIIIIGSRGLNGLQEFV